MTVEELIEQLMQVKDKKKIVKLSVNDTITGNFHLNDNLTPRLYLSNAMEKGYIPKDIDLLEKFEMLERENGDMAEKHAEKDIALNNLHQDYKRLKEALEEISNIGYSDKFGGGWTYTGEYHARCMKIAMETLKKHY